MHMGMWAKCKSKYSIQHTTTKQIKKKPQNTITPKFTFKYPCELTIKKEMLKISVN